jgi:hypothetical protein
MLRYRKCLIIPVCLTILAFAINALAEEDVEDQIDIAESSGKIIAIVEGKRTISTDLRPDEQVLWSGARGDLGAFLTSLHFFAIATASDAWQTFSLRLDESDKGVVSLSPYIVLLVTGDRAIGFDAATNRFIETQLPFHDELLTAKAEKYVAVVITSSRAFGLAAESAAFSEIPLRVRETVKDVKTTSRKAILRTTDRLLTFESTGTAWKEFRLD